MQQIGNWIEMYPNLKTGLWLVAIIFIAWLAFFITHRVLIVLLKKMAARSKTRFDDYLVDSKALGRMAFIVPVVVVNAFSVLLPRLETFIGQATRVLMAWIAIRVLAAVMGALNNWYETLPKSKERPIKGYVQVAVMVVYILGTIFIIGTVTGQSPWVLMSGIGAMTAVLLLIFRDTILSFVAGIQITGYDLLHVGDWIEMPEYGADGDVIDIALHTVKVQNWDKTITVIPTHKLTENSFKNWRGMQQAGGRRIKRAIYLDQNSIKLVDDTLLKRFEDILLLKDYVAEKKTELEKYNAAHPGAVDNPANRRRLTNIGTFRMYAQKYLEQHPEIRHDLTTMVRQLPPGPNGLPLEIYAFTSTTEWLAYERIQSDIFDHLLSVVDVFDLQIFQNPAGRDFRQLNRS